MRCAAILVGAILLGGAPAAAQSSGHYARGRLEGAVALPEQGPNHYLVLTPHCYAKAPLSRHYPDPARARNFYAHPGVVQAVQDIAEQVRLQLIGAPRLAVGELSNVAGGRIPFHMSHQNGLDVDILYLQRALPQGTQLTPVPLCFDGPRFEIKGPDGWALRPDFELAWNWALVAAIAQRPDVRSIFVGGVVRRELLAWAKGRAPAAERARVEERLVATWCRPPKGVQMGTFRNNRCPHDDHLHVRFHCPDDSPACTERR